ncbi:MAG TPA: response regulator [Woeseiaceae bacterium]
MDPKPQVLVIDDDAVVGRSFDRVLTKKGYEVNTALTGEEGLERIEAKNYDVVFTDIQMPGMNGMEVAEHIKSKCPWTPVVVITGYGTEEHEAQASVLGVSGFVHKPLTPEIIESITLKALAPRETSPEAANEAEVAPAAMAVPEPSVLRKVGFVAKNITLFFLSPLIALGYVIALPLIGFYLIGKFSVQTIHEKIVSH